MTAVKDFRVHQSGIRFASSCRRAAMFLEKPAGTLRSQETSPPLNRRHAVGKMLGPGRTGPDQAGLPVPSWPRSPSISIRCATRTMRCSVHGCDMLRVRQDCVRPASGPSAGGASSVRRCGPPGRCGTCRRMRRRARSAARRGFTGTRSTPASALPAPGYSRPGPLRGDRRSRGTGSTGTGRPPSVGAAALVTSLSQRLATPLSQRLAAPCKPLICDSQGRG